MIFISEDEQIENLNIGNLKILQKKDGFRFGTDAVLLADYARRRVSGNILDMCSGSGIVALLLADGKRVKSVTALEIQEAVADMARRSVMINNLQNKISVVSGDLKDSERFFGKNRFDAVTCNPPYMKLGSALINENDNKFISRHEVCCTLEDVIRVSASMLKYHGRFFMVHKPTRLVEIITVMSGHGIEPKRMRLVYAGIKKEPSLVLIEGMSGGNPEMRVEAPFYIYENGDFSEEMKRIYTEV